MFQNLETSSISRQHATILLDSALEQSKWELAKDLVRFLRAIGKYTYLTIDLLNFYFFNLQTQMTLNLPVPLSSYLKNWVCRNRRNLWLQMPRICLWFLATCKGLVSGVTVLQFLRKFLILELVVMLVWALCLRNLQLFGGRSLCRRIIVDRLLIIKLIITGKHSTLKIVLFL